MSTSDEEFARNLKDKAEKDAAKKLAKEAKPIDKATRKAMREDRKGNSERRIWGEAN